MKAPIRIVAATDLSAPARHAVERAFHLAKQSGGELHILHALELDALDSLKELIGASLSSTKDALDADARQRLMQLTGDLTRKHGFNAQWRVVPGNPRTAVMSEADVLDAGMLVLGARGASFLRRTMLGSTSTRLLRKSIRRPVLVVKRPPYEGYRNVLVAVDFSPVSLHLIQAAKQWAARAELFLCHAFELPFEGMLWRAGIDKEQIAPLIGGGKSQNDVSSFLSLRLRQD
ncbi:universal stress protein [Oxalobacteraceae bacterium R-40]|uniref:Universal stress protein n=1 Tax=Keguizhuia sedimenti TaxID=3064264 RepID=A0ABU1BP68_9BURK|nr:universal stress protein [Oxalobacteraceae bacterium R-40]